MTVAALLAAISLAACDSGDGEDTAATGPGESGEPAPSSGDPQVVKTQSRIERALASGDCKRVNQLNPLSRPQLDTRERCESLKRLAGLEPAGGKRYGRGGAVLDYARGERTISAVAILDADDRFHVAFIDPFLGEPSVGTRLDRKLDKAALSTAAALRDGSCEAAIGVAYRHFGPGSGPRGAACARLRGHPLTVLLKSDPEAQPKPLGGNGSYAFYAVESGGIELTMVMARQAEAPDLPDDLGDLPADAAPYAFVDAYRVDEGAREGGG